MESELEQLRYQLAAANARIRELEADRAKPWGYRLSTVAPPDAPGTTYPSIGETYELALVDTGYSERLLLLKSKELDDRIQQLEATIDACKAAVFVTESGEVRKVLGTLPITADGCVIGDDCKVWFQGQYVNVEPMRSSVSGESDWHAFRCDKVYSSAEAAKGGREG